MDARLVRTSVTIDEAVAILLGWITGPVIYTFSEQGLTDEEYDSLPVLTFSLKDELDGRESDCENELIDAQVEGCPESVVAEKRAALAKHKELAQLAMANLCAINDEINKGERSALHVDTGLSNSLITYITLTSLNEWLVDRDKKPSCGAIPEKLATASEAIKLPPQPRRKMRDQEDAILNAFESLGYSPKSLSRNEPGKPGVKAAIRQALKTSPLFQARRSFDKAWEQLRKDGAIAESG